jgi:hypothetical protein
LAISGCSLATSEQILPKNENCEAMMRLLRNSTIRAGRHSNDALECFDEGADAAVTDGKACFRN